MNGDVKCQKEYGQANPADNAQFVCFHSPNMAIIRPPAMELKGFTHAS